MNIYEFIIPSDPITFKAENDDIAFVCALLLGRGKAGCNRVNNGDEVGIPSMLMFHPEPEKFTDDYLQIPVKQFIEENKTEIANAFDSFAYGSVESRITYDEALEAITDDKKRDEFREKHENRNRTSMNQWVLAAWKYAVNMRMRAENE